MLQLHNLISDITGVTGLRIVRDLLAGVRDPQALAAHRDYRCRAPEEEIAASLTGNYHPEHLFALRQNFEAYEFHKRQIEACDAAIEAHRNSLAGVHDQPEAALPCATQDQTSTTTPFRDPLTAASTHRRCGPEPDQLHRPRHRPTAHWRDRPRHEPLALRETLHLLAHPRPEKQDLGRETAQLQDSAIRKSRRRHPTALCHEPRSYHYRPRTLRPFYRRLAYRVGKAKAISATARKLALIVYRVLRGDFAYADRVQLYLSSRLLQK